MIWNYPHAILLDGGVLRALSVKSPYRIVYKAVTPLAPEYSTWEPSTKATVTRVINLLIGLFVAALTNMDVQRQVLAAYQLVAPGLRPHAPVLAPLLADVVVSATQGVGLGQVIVRWFIVWSVFRAAQTQETHSLAFGAPVVA